MTVFIAPPNKASCLLIATCAAIEALDGIVVLVECLLTFPLPAVQKIFYLAPVCFHLAFAKVEI